MKDLKHFKDLLEIEVQKLETELRTVGIKDPEKKDEWEAVENDDRDRVDESEVADGIEDFENNSAVLEQLQARLKEVTVALEKIEEGTFGTCEVCGKEIEEDRLKANPSANTCKEHMSL